jgi:thioredoxin-like negative regulator of GroEL
VTLQEIEEGGSKKPYLVLFYGPSCAPCASLKPKLRQACLDLEVDLHEISILDDMDAVRELGIRTVPAVVLFKAASPPRVIFNGDLPHVRVTLIASGIPIPGLPA